MRGLVSYIAFITSVCAMGVVALLLRTYQQPSANSATEMLSLQQLMMSEIQSDERGRSREESLTEERTAAKDPAEIKRLDESIRDVQLRRKIAQEREEQYRKRMEQIRGQI